MVSSDQLAQFIAASFRSVWALELLLLLRREQRALPAEELVTLLRASPSVVDTAVDSLLAAGLVGTDEGGVRYMPAGAQVDTLVGETERLYRTHPDRVRRRIVTSSNRGLAAFSNAFRLKD